MLDEDGKMTPEQIAQQTIDYLDSIGIVADYEINTNDRYAVTIISDNWSFQLLANVNDSSVIKPTKEKSPN